jgi:hypothetical protein
MPKIGKKYAAARARVPADQKLPPSEALALL